MKTLMKYQLYILLLSLICFSCSSSEDDQQPLPEEEEEMTLEGDYTGSWDDNIYTSFPISARLSEPRENFFSGPFFYSQNGSFVPCCQDAENNGIISFEVKGDSIVNFIYNQQLVFYMGGCPGTYRGKGIINAQGWLLIDFTGDDCDGTHTGGKIVLRKK